MKSVIDTRHATDSSNKETAPDAKILAVDPRDVGIISHGLMYNKV